MPTEDQKAPKPGESTGSQVKKQSTFSAVGGSYDSGLKVSPGTFEVYDKISRNPTVALALLVATAPVRSTPVTIDADDGVPEEQTAFVQAQVTLLWSGFVKDAVRALKYGFQAFEEVWAAADDGSLVIERLKSLTPKDTDPVVDDSGNLTGAKNFDTTLPVNKVLWVANEPEHDNWYGRARLENIREGAWAEWCDVNERARLYAKRVAGAVPMVSYPDGENQDASGATRPNHELARDLVNKLEHCQGVYMPRIMLPWAEDAVRNGGDPTKLLSWEIGFLEAKGQHGADLIDMMKHRESLMMRGILVPERSATEASTAGSRADSESHADIGLTISDLFLQDLIAVFNDQAVNRLLRYNYGAKAERTVRVARAGLDPAMVAFFRQILATALGQPANIDLLLEMIDFDQMLDAAGLPKSRESITPEELAAKLDARGQAGGAPPEKEPPMAASLVVRDIYRMLHRSNA